MTAHGVDLQIDVYYQHRASHDDIEFVKTWLKYDKQILKYDWNMIKLWWKTN